ncbi:hypothetical protein AALO_G00272620, partial [Alosa alosa]
ALLTPSSLSFSFPFLPVLSLPLLFFSCLLSLLLFPHYPLLLLYSSSLFFSSSPLLLLSSSPFFSWWLRVQFLDLVQMSSSLVSIIANLLCYQKFSDDTAIVGCIRNGQEEEYRSLVEDLQLCNGANSIIFNLTLQRPRKWWWISAGLSPLCCQSTLMGLMWRWLAPTSIWVSTWTINWTGKPTLMHSTRKGRAGCTS